MRKRFAKLAWLPWWWYAFLAALAIVGIALICANPLIPWLRGFSSLVKPDSWAVLIGILLVAIGVTHVLTFFPVQGIDVLFDLAGESGREDLWPPTLVGVMEGLMYPVAIAVGSGEFIGIWLAVKVAGQWVRWGTETPTGRARVLQAKKGRRRFNKFLIGNALRIVLAVITYGLLRATVLRQHPFWAA